MGKNIPLCNINALEFYLLQYKCALILPLETEMSCKVPPLPEMADILPLASEMRRNFTSPTTSRDNMPIFLVFIAFFRQRPHLYFT